MSTSNPMGIELSNVLRVGQNMEKKSIGTIVAIISGGTLVVLAALANCQPSGWIFWLLRFLSVCLIHRDTNCWLLGSSNVYYYLLLQFSKRKGLKHFYAGVCFLVFSKYNIATFYKNTIRWTCSKDTYFFIPTASLISVISSILNVVLT